MSYSADELFEFREMNGEYFLVKYLKKDDPTVTELEIPAEYNGAPVVSINLSAFGNSDFLREVIIPDSIKTIGEWAFHNCPELRRIRLPKEVSIQKPGFLDCPKLDPQIVMAGLVGNPTDLSKPFGLILRLEWDDILRPDVFALAVKYDSFREIGTEMLFKQIVRRGLFPHFDMLENAGKSPSAEQTDALIKFSSESGYTEMTAYLLDYKNRRFGFDFKNGGDKFEL